MVIFTIFSLSVETLIAVTWNIINRRMPIYSQIEIIILILNLILILFILTC